MIRPRKGGRCAPLALFLWIQSVAASFFFGFPPRGNSCGIPLLLLFTAYNAPLQKILNLDVIATEIVRALTGSIGFVAAIPLTAFFAALLATREKLRHS